MTAIHRETVAVMAAALAALQVLVGGADVIPPQVATLAVLIVGAATVGLGTYIRGNFRPTGE